MKELLEKLSKGESTVDDVLKAIDEADKDKVPRSRLNDKIDEVKELNSQIKERDTQLDELGKKVKDNDDLTTEIGRLKQENQSATEELQSKLSQQQFDFALEKAITGEKARNPKAVKALLDTESIKLDGDKLLGLDEQLKGLKESDAYLFGEADKLGGRDPHNSDPNGAPQKVTKDQFNQMGYTDREKLYSDNPELYKQLTN